MEAEGKDETKQILKSLGWPAMDDPDGVPSAYLPRVLKCMSSSNLKMSNLVASMNDTEDEEMGLFLVCNS